LEVFELNRLAHPELALTAIITLLLFVSFILVFNRDPERFPPKESGIIVAVADGKIDEISPIEEYPGIELGGILVSTFMSPFDVHVNRAPISGKVVLVTKIEGKKRIALSKKREGSEKTIVVIDGGGVKVAYAQIPGIIARRVSCLVKEGDYVEMGERVGKILLGSRVDLIVPKNANILVKVGDRVKAGETIIARLS